MKDDKHREISKTDAQWRAQLDATQYEVARQAGTERAFTGKYWDHWEKWPLRLHRLRHAAVCGRHQVRCGLRLA